MKSILKTKRFFLLFLLIIGVIFGGCSSDEDDSNTANNNTITSVVPQDAQTNVPLDTEITVNFSKAMNTDTLTSDNM